MQQSPAVIVTSSSGYSTDGLTAALLWNSPIDDGRRSAPY